MQAEALHHLEHQVQELSNTITLLRRSHDDISKQAQVCALTMSLGYTCTCPSWGSARGELAAHVHGKHDKGDVAQRTDAVAG